MPGGRGRRRRDQPGRRHLYAGDTLDMARVLGLLPFFVLGLKATPERLELLRTPAGRRWPRSRVLVGDLDPHRLHRRAGRAPSGSTTASRYDELGTPTTLRALLTRAAGARRRHRSARCAFLALVPRIGGWFTRMGACDPGRLPLPRLRR